eukprot:11114234-Karenia_brevis.AAC.1
MMTAFIPQIPNDAGSTSQYSYLGHICMLPSYLNHHCKGSRSYFVQRSDVHPMCQGHMYVDHCISKVLHKSGCLFSLPGGNGAAQSWQP